MSDSIRAALERLVELDGLPDSWSPAGIQAWDDAIAAGKAALAEQQGEGPSDEELTQLLFDNFRGPIEFICDAEEVAHVMIRNHIKFARAVLARWGRQPTPPAEGEVGELVAALRRLAPQNPLGTADPTITRAAELLQQQEAEINRLRAQQLPGDREATAIEALKRLRQWGRISCVGSYSPAGGYSADVLVGVLDWIDGGMEGPLPPLPAHALPIPQGVPAKR